MRIDIHHSDDTWEIWKGSRGYFITNTGRPKENISDEATSPVYIGGVLVSRWTCGTWAYIDRQYINLILR